MCAAKQVDKPRLSEGLQKRIAEHREVVAKLREVYPDPLEALFVFTRDTFDELSFVPDGRRSPSRRTRSAGMMENDE